MCTLPGYMPAGRSSQCCGCGSAQRSDDVVSPFPLSALCSISCGCGTLLGQCWATIGAHRAEGEALVPTTPHQHPPGSLGCSVSQPSGYLAAIFLCPRNPKTAEMLVPRRKEEPRVTPWQRCPSHLSHQPLAARATGPPTLVCVRGAPPAPGLHGHFVAL